MFLEKEKKIAMKELHGEYINVQNVMKVEWRKPLY